MRQVYEQYSERRGFMIEAINISKSYHNKVIIDSFSTNIEKNSLTVITGQSGKGKTTLLNILSMIEKPDNGVVRIDNIAEPDQKQLRDLRRYTLAYLFQNYGLVEEDTAERNLSISLTYRKNAKLAISEALEKVGLSHYEKRKVYELSGGEQQRVALARVLLKDSSYIFADEPTGNLDKDNRDVVIKLLREMADNGKGVVLATHDMELVPYADQYICLS